MNLTRPKLPDQEFAAVPGPRRRYIWEFGADLERTNWWLFVTCSLLLFCTICLSIVIVVIFGRPPMVLSDDQGYVVYRSTEAFRLDELRVKTYSDLVLSKLLNMNPGVYDISSIARLASSKVIDAYTQHAYETAQDRVKVNERRYFSFIDARRYLDPKFPALIVLAVRGEMAYFREGDLTDEEAQTSSLSSTSPTTTRRASSAMATPGQVRTQSQVVTYLIYVQQIRPTPSNPWGLVTVGISQKQGDEAKQVWEDSIPLYSTILPDGTVISARNQQEQEEKIKQEIKRAGRGVRTQRKKEEAESVAPQAGS